MTSAPIGRFAPSTTGEAHLGTMLAAMLAWLAAKAPGGRCYLRLEDLDPNRSHPRLVSQMEQDLAWLGLTFDGTVRQSALAAGHMQALDTLAQLGLLYACSCSRAHIAQHGRLTAAGERIYNNACRASPSLSQTQWRLTSGTLRARVNALTSDPVVRRRDGSVAYLLACVVDDAAMGITEVVRGRDLLDQEPIQRAIGSLLGLPIPSYKHHLLLLEPRGRKLAKMHGSLPLTKLKKLASAEVWVGTLAYLAGISPEMKPATVQSLISHFDFAQLGQTDRVVMLQDGQFMACSGSKGNAESSAQGLNQTGLCRLDLPL